MPGRQVRPHPRSAGLWTVIAVAAWIMAWVTKSYGADLWDIYQLALTNDPQYQAAVLGHESNRINLPLARAAFKPSVTADARLDHQRTDAPSPDTSPDTSSNTSPNTSSSPPKTRDDRFVNLNFDLLLHDQSKRAAITQSEHQVAVSALRLRDARQRLILRVAKRYFNLLAAQDARQVARLEKTAIRRQMDLTRKRLEVGLGTQTDLFDARARFKLAEANEIQAQNQINNDLALLQQIIGKQIIGITPAALSVLNDSAPLELPTPNDVDAWINQSTDHNVPLKVEALNLEIAWQEIDKQKVRRSPTLSFEADHRWFDAGDSSNTSSAALVMRFPFYLGGAINLATQQAGLEYNRIERLLEQARRLASVETTSAFLAVASGVSQVEALFDAVSAGMSALEAKQQGFRAGLTTNLDVLDAQRDLSRSRTDYLRTRYNYIIAVLELERSAGQLDEQDLKRVNSWLDVSAQ